MDVKAPRNTHDIVLQGILKRKRREWLKRKEEEKAEKAEQDLKGLGVVSEKYYIDMETEAWLKSATELLFREFPGLDIGKKREVVEWLADQVSTKGPPEEPMKAVVRDAVNRVVG